MTPPHPPMPPDAILDALLKSVACGILVLDPDGRVLRMNDSGEVITGRKKQTVIGQRCRDVLRLPGPPRPTPPERILQQGIAYDERTITVIGRDDIELTLRLASRLVVNSNGELLGAVVSFGDLSTVHDLRLRLDSRLVFQGMVSQHHRMRALFEVLPRMAQSNSTVLIRGETGTGKDLIARAIHDLSDRADRPFVSVNTAALPDTLLEAELFGHTKGAFTDAKSDRAGRVAVAEGGTLFLDEIGDISPAMQVKLLRFLQERKYEPLGSSRSRQADVRVIAATNRPLEDLMRKGTYREDFYFRLNVLSVEVPPLRDRINDVPLLVEHFLQRLALIESNVPLSVAPEALEALLAYDYPGNVRELENIIERAAVLARGEWVGLDDLPDSLRSGGIGFIGERSTGNGAVLLNPIEQAERDAISAMLSQCDGQRQAAARKLGMSRSTLWRKIRKYGLQHD